MSWREDRLGNVVTLKRGHDLPESARKEGDIPIVSSSGITGFHNVAKAEPPGVVTGRYGTLGEVFYIDQPYWPLNTALYAIDFHGNDPRFVAYFLRLALKGTKSDKAAVPGVNRNDLHERKVRVPELDVQTDIVNVLCQYDDLIENNRRRIKLLEEAARLIYREWFVRLRFPGYEHTKIENGVPEGWERSTLGHEAVIVMGQSPDSKFYNDEGLGLPFHQGVKDFGVRFPVTSTWCNGPGRIAELGDVLLSVRAPVGRLNFAPAKMVIGRGLAALRAKDERQALMFHHLRAFFFVEDRIGSGAIYAAVTKDEVFNIEVLKPTEEIANEFEEVVGAMEKQIGVLDASNARLHQARDLLLPRLMSGEIDV